MLATWGTGATAHIGQSSEYVTVVIRIFVAENLDTWGYPSAVPVFKLQAKSYPKHQDTECPDVAFFRTLLLLE